MIKLMEISQNDAMNGLIDWLIDEMNDQIEQTSENRRIDWSNLKLRKEANYFLLSDLASNALQETAVSQHETERSQTQNVDIYVISSWLSTMKRRFQIYSHVIN